MLRPKTIHRRERRGHREWRVSLRAKRSNRLPFGEGDCFVVSLLAMTHDAASHIGVFGEGPGEGVFAKTPSPENSCLSDLRLLCGEQSFSCAAELDKGGLAG